MDMIVPPNASHPIPTPCPSDNPGMSCFVWSRRASFFPLRRRLLFAAWNYRKFMEFGRLLKSPFEDDVRPSPSDRRTIYE